MQMIPGDHSAATAIQKKYLPIFSKGLIAKETNHKNASEERCRSPMHRFFQRFPFLFFAKVKACIETVCTNVETADGNDMVHRARECRLFSDMNGGHDGGETNIQRP